MKTNYQEKKIIKKCVILFNTPVEKHTKHLYQFMLTIRIYIRK